MLPHTNRGLPQTNNRGMLQGLVNKESINMSNKKSLQNTNRNHRKKRPKKKQSKRVNQRKSSISGKKKQLNKRSKVVSSEPLVDQNDQIKKQSNDLADNEDYQSELGQMSNRYKNNLIKDFWESSEKESKEEAHNELHDNRKDLIFLEF